MLGLRGCKMGTDRHEVETAEVLKVWLELISCLEGGAR